MLLDSVVLNYSEPDLLRIDVRVRNPGPNPIYVFDIAAHIGDEALRRDFMRFQALFAPPDTLVLAAVIRPKLPGSTSVVPIRFLASRVPSGELLCSSANVELPIFAAPVGNLDGPGYRFRRNGTWTIERCSNLEIVMDYCEEDTVLESTPEPSLGTLAYSVSESALQCRRRSVARALLERELEINTNWDVR